MEEKRSKDESRSKRKAERSDKKRAINLTILLPLYDVLYRLAYICNRPLKDIGEELCFQGIRTRTVIEKIAPFLRRDFIFLIKGDIVYCGNPDQHRINLRFRK